MRRKRLYPGLAAGSSKGRHGTATPSLMHFSRMWEPVMRAANFTESGAEQAAVTICADSALLHAWTRSVRHGAMLLGPAQA